jgi:thiol:disulfide interchange protein
MTIARMRALAAAIMTLLFALALPLLAPATGQGVARADKHLKMRLVAESVTPRSGAPLMLAIDTVPEAGWHGYWRNPGDAGFPATFDWRLPAGAKAGAVQWPVPTTLLIAGLMNYVYERPYAPLVTIDVPAGLKPGTAFPIAVTISYLVCTDAVCVPEQQSLASTLVIGDGRATDNAAFDRWRQAIPAALDAQATYAARDGAVTIAIPYPAAAAAAQPYFFPITAGAIDYAAPQTITRSGDVLTIATRGKAGAELEGVLRIGAAKGLAIRAVPGEIGTTTDAGGGSIAIAAFFGALLGGLILNVMPCVFPILSLKALSLARSGASERDARHEALAYAAGVIAVCLLLGGIILALRAGGSTVGWAFQLQDPRAIVVLLLLSVAIALNLSGLFEVPMPRFAGSSGAGGAFATGALAAFVATPCTGPFMGAALGAALVLPWYAALAIFAGLGLGLALPFLAIGYVPALRRRLPKPGAWMETFRHALSIPMWLTAIALAWVLGRQSGVDGMTQGLFGALLLGLLFWAAGRRQRRGQAIGVVLALLMIGVLVGSAATVRRTAAAPASTTAGEPFSEERLAALRGERRPVFVYFTADWCLTCKVNEKAAIDTDAARAAFARNKVAVLVGDWTDGDAAMGRFIQQHNRAGVPLYLYYAPGAAAPKVLPQLLTPGMLEGLGA